MSDKQGRKPALTLAQLIQAIGAQKLDARTVRLVRHTMPGDSEILRKDGIQPPSDRDLIDGEEKLVALRLDRRLTEAYTADQDKDVFRSQGLLAERLLVFAAADGADAEFLGCWKITGNLSHEEYRSRYSNLFTETPDSLQKLRARQLFRGLGLSGLTPASDHLYALEPDPDVLRGFEGRLIVRWNNPRGWVARSLDLEVTELRASGFVRPFPGYDKVNIPFVELKTLINNPEGNPEWRHRLDAMSGVYLITDQATGKLYVGSAYGDRGIWQRWETYAATMGHAGNEGLKALIEMDQDYARNFRFSLLQVMGRSVVKSEVIAAEGRWKEKLGSRSERLGYNEN